ncbi:MAG: L,D-transpeptidase/peptidoglycan binding protein, partial [Chloroflexota bacterium]|nr:L,D-transpeptidase/peptidoglycan binding protein [Chloroflexota bacterium]
PPPPPRIAAGVRAGGVDIGGLTIEEATVRLERGLGRRLRSPVTVRAAGKRFRLRMPSLRFHFDAKRTAQRGYRAGSARPQPVPGIPVEPLDVRPVISFSRPSVRRFVAQLASRVDVAPRDATLRITLRRMIRRPGRGGRRLDQRRLGSAILRLLRAPAARRSVRGVRRKVVPGVTYRQLPRRYPTVLTIDRGNFRLRLFKHLRVAKTYPIAVGAAGTETPAGLFRIQSKQVNPAWHVPNSPWAGSLAGQTIPGGAPNNPLKARWLGIAGGAGIHGTAEAWSVGSRASHGCIRMHVPDVIDLYPRVPIGAPVLIR